MSLRQEEMADMIFILGECQKNPLLASGTYAQSFPQRRHPQEVSFEILLHRFVHNGQTKYEQRGGPKTIFTEENEFLVLASVQENPYVSSRQITTTCDISRTVQRIKKKHGYHPYHVQLHQELLDTDFDRRRVFCQWACDKLTEDDSFFSKILFSDESTFRRNGFVNGHNFHYYDTENPHIIRSASQHRWSLNVWAGILGTRIVGPIFFNGHLTGQMYLEFLQNDLDNLLWDIPLATIRDMWIQHDGAPAHRQGLPKCSYF